MNKSSAIYILGGMGPQASSYMYGLLIEMSVRYFGAKNNDDFPEIILHSIPVPDFISSDNQQAEALAMLQDRTVRMNNMRLSYLSIACNTTHVLLNQLQSFSRAPYKYGISTVVPNKKQLVTLEKISRKILRGKKLESDKIKLISIADSLRQKGAKGIILGCTELPLVFPSKYSLPVYNSIEILAMALLRKYYR